VIVLEHQVAAFCAQEKNVRRFLDGWTERHADFVSWFRVHFFRFWTATAILLLFGLSFWYAPELLTSWQKAVLNLIQGASDMLPYPWSNRVQFIMVNFGASIWLQFTLAIILLRVLCWPVGRWFRRRKRKKREFNRMQDRIGGGHNLPG
jgi:membrane protein implicated in regulation of membrane protease activity